MSKHEKHFEKFISFNTSENTKNPGLGRKESKFWQKVQRLNVLNFLAGLSQILIGSIVIVISILGFIQPVWLSLMLNVFAAMVVVMGAWFCYSAVSSLSTDTLLREAMRRIMEARN